MTIEIGKTYRIRDGRGSVTIYATMPPTRDGETMLGMMIWDTNAYRPVAYRPDGRWSDGGDHDFDLIDPANPKLSAAEVRKRDIRVLTALGAHLAVAVTNHVGGAGGVMLDLSLSDTETLARAVKAALDTYRADPGAQQPNSTQSISLSRIDKSFLDGAAQKLRERRNYVEHQDHSADVTMTGHQIDVLLKVAGMYLASPAASKF